jgi:hypothetical protein
LTISYFTTKFEPNENILFFTLSLISWIFGTTVILHVTYLFYNGKKNFKFLNSNQSEKAPFSQNPQQKN